MGMGLYSVCDAYSKSTTRATRSVSQNFTSRTIDKEMVLGDKIREARDSEQHPNSFRLFWLSTLPAAWDVSRRIS